MQELWDFEEVIDRLGGSSEAARMCGQQPAVITNWRKRRLLIPTRYYWEVRCLLEERGYYPAIDLFNFHQGPAVRKYAPMIAAVRVAAHEPA